MILGAVGVDGWVGYYLTINTSFTKGQRKRSRLEIKQEEVTKGGQNFKLMWIFNRRVFNGVWNFAVSSTSAVNPK